ncbi:endolytic transglycosylase MltG [Aminithiophilus ramosus]|uniref:Endolytic murein transglycosylase n=2 Tax=Synergistales TaxID=649776 RepID=A0A9Q7ABJ7_9BACT|nr:endolytic transglycosylase MltG [Aminithiophilus ramosus]QVL37425.1 endolytic transglycosylase MltG [Synergistota bacterium]
MTAYEAAVELQHQGFVDDGRALARWMTKFGIDRNLRPGLYRIRRGSPWEVARQIRSEEPELRRVTLIPGTDGDEWGPYREALEKKALFPQELQGLLPEIIEDRILFLLPETYYVVPGFDEAEQVVRQASRLWLQKLGGRELSAQEVLGRGILASIVEKEVRLDSERSLAASVFLNRLDRKMALQSCATVVYAWKERGRRLARLSHEDLKIDSPFNTYLHSGLPPHPICLPGLVSWRAALEPAESDFLFFVAKGDGSHIFTRTYKEHLQAQKK